MLFFQKEMHARCPRLRKEYLRHVSLAFDLNSSRVAAFKLSERCKQGMRAPVDVVACALYYGDADVRVHLLRYIPREALLESLKLLSMAA